MAKDPAILFYKDKWLMATSEMDSDVRGWYLNLILHQFDKGSLPNDPEVLAILAGVKYSEYERFKQVLEQVLKQKLTTNEANGRLENKFASEILQNRERFKEKRGRSGNIGVVIKLAKTITGFTEKHILTLKKFLYEISDEEIEKHKNKQMLEHLLKLYINVNINNKDIYNNYSYINIEGFEKIFKRWIEYKIKRKEKYKSEDSIIAAYKKLVKLSNSDPLKAHEIIDDAIANNYAGFFALKNNNIPIQETSKMEDAIQTVNNLLRPE